MQLRIGNGYDIHRLVPNRALILGGEIIKHPEQLGLDGHSDADVIVHALIDALLGALSLGDIGKYFPPEDPKWKGVESLTLLSEVISMIYSEGWSIINVDAVLILERPRIKHHIEKMRRNIAYSLKVNEDQVGIKATTNEKIGSIGREEGIACHAVALLSKLDMGVKLL